MGRVRERGAVRGVREVRQTLADRCRCDRTGGCWCDRTDARRCEATDARSVRGAASRRVPTLASLAVPGRRFATVRASLGSCADSCRCDFMTLGEIGAYRWIEFVPPDDLLLDDVIARLQRYLLGLRAVNVSWDSGLL